MANQQWVFSRALTHQTTCPRCATEYAYDRQIEVRRDTKGRAEPAPEEMAEIQSELDSLAASDSEVVKCPHCGAMRAGAFKWHLMQGLFIVIWIALCIGAAALILAVAAGSGALFWGLGILVLLGGVGGVLALASWLLGLFGVGLKKGRYLQAQPERG